MNTTQRAFLNTIFTVIRTVVGAVLAYLLTVAVLAALGRAAYLFPFHAGVIVALIVLGLLVWWYYFLGDTKRG